MSMARHPAASPDELFGDRLVLRCPTASELAAFLGGEREAGWAPDFPQPGDVDAVKLGLDAGQASDGEAGYGARLVIVRATGTVVGTAGFHGPPIQGEVELGYGIVPSARYLGYASEAALLLAAFALEQPGVTMITAHTDEHNEGSQNVLLAAGFMPVETEGPHVTFHYAGPRTDYAVLEVLAGAPDPLPDPV